ncbi:MAG: hypothetical protein JWM31_939 [Solirubrobacterales bacterium]|nr:hypothetical protein [Solirubrobacterales bacterium]
MPSSTFARFGAAAAACFACSTPVAHAADGGLAFGSPTAAAPAAGDAGTLFVKTAVILGRTLRVQVTMAHGQPGRQVIVQRQEKDGDWVPTATATTTDGGAFTATWKTDHIGRFPIRALPSPTPGVSAASVPSTGTTPVTVYRQSVATYFGPGFFGQQTACGQTLRKTTLGVAHRALPCGTLVDLYYKGRSITVPVIDRGPFRKDTTWDLTSATADALGVTSTVRIGALRMPKAAAAAASTR